MTHLRTNVGFPERLLSAFGAAYLLYDIISRRRVSHLQVLAGSYLLVRGVTGFCAVYQTLGKTETKKARNVNIKTVLRVNRPRHQVYACWRKLEELPRFMKHLKSVTVVNEGISEWKAYLPKGLGTVSWKSEIVKDDPGSTLSWHSLPDSTIENAGKIEFRDAGESTTEVHVVISYHAPLGVAGEKASRLLNPLFEDMVKEDIRNFKFFIETGEISVASDKQ
jgi:uncharacterized membrane protein